MQESVLSPLEKRIIHALQVNPRAQWSELAPVLGAAPTTLARHWDRLRAEGLAWTTAFLPSGIGALIDISCEPRHVAGAMTALSEFPELITIDHTAGQRDIIATAMTRSHQEVGALVTRRIGAIPGVLRTQTHFVTAMHVEASVWRMRALSASEQARVPLPRPPRRRAPRLTAPEVEAALREELPRDARVPVSRIAQAHGLSEQRVADGLARMLADGDLILRTDVARPVTGWPVYTWYFVSAPAALIPRMATLLRQVPEVRTAMSVASEHNLIMAVWLRDLSEVSRFEAAVEAALRGARIRDRGVVFSTAKHMGHHLDANGHATGVFTHPLAAPACTA
ncbi:Lrp/AsnC family transcriptional regulator [Brevibacterium salitolerans]|uniref:Lrp/AsnC family transcriptional regulator n=1 Tax=Brevibacterium salitolerans TaxID=1403566 RepID=A0ABN2WH86_9MICO